MTKIREDYDDKISIVLIFSLPNFNLANCCIIQVKYGNIIIQKRATFVSFLDFTEQFFSNL